MENIAVVTGANKGLGFSIVKRLCENYDGTVYLTSRDEKRGKDAVEKAKKNDINNAKYHQLDISSPESIRAFCDFLLSENLAIDILINNAGILFLKDAKEAKAYQAEQTVSVNFFSLINFTENVLRFMTPKATIINISSSSGHLSRIPSLTLRNKLSSPDLNLPGLKKLIEEYIESVKENTDEKEWGDSPYVVSKVGVNAYTFQLQRKLRYRGITVNCIHPGYVMSDMTRGAGSITPDEAAEMVVQFALKPNGGGKYIWHNGQEVPWDGVDPRIYIDGKS